MLVKVTVTHAWGVTFLMKTDMCGCWQYIHLKYYHIMQVDRCEAIKS